MSLDLTLETHQTNAGPYTLTFGRKEAPLNVQEAAFAANAFEMVSPAQLGFLRANQQEGDTTFNNYSRTSADVFYDDRGEGQVVIVPNGIISTQVGIANLVNADRQNKEYIIPPEQRKEIYALVDAMLGDGTAFVAQYGETRVNTSDFGQNDLTSRLFSDARLGIKAQDYGDWLQSQGRTEQCFSFDTESYAKARGSPYLNRLRLCGSIDDFDILGDDWNLIDNIGAFGVRFEKAAAGGSQQR